MKDKESKSDWIEQKCPACNGTGSETVVRLTRPGQVKISPSRCPACGGTGRIPKNPEATD
jgi:DnaJ-class molecular chaperone